MKKDCDAEKTELEKPFHIFFRITMMISHREKRGEWESERDEGIVEGYIMISRRRKKGVGSSKSWRIVKGKLMNSHRKEKGGCESEEDRG